MRLPSKIRYFFSISSPKNFINQYIKDLFKKFTLNLINIDLACVKGNYVVKSIMYKKVRLKR